jgi:hypothetical protein
MMMCVVSPVALGPTMRSTDRILPSNGALLPKVFSGTSPFSSSSGTLALPALGMVFCAVVFISRPRP